MTAARALAVVSLCAAALIVAVSHAEAQSADPPACAPYRAKWESVAGGQDVAAMGQTIAVIPTLCPALAAEARAHQASVKAQAAANDPCGPAFRAWPAVRDQNDIGEIRAFMAGSVVAGCKRARDQAQDAIDQIASLRKNDPAPTSQDSGSFARLMNLFGKEVPNAPPEELLIWARNFTRGSNVAIDACSPGLGNLTSAQPCSGPSVAEYDITATRAATYALRVKYFSMSVHSVRVLINGQVLKATALTQTTSKWGQSESIGDVQLRVGTNTLRIESTGTLPAIEEIRLNPYAN